MHLVELCEAKELDAETENGLHNNNKRSESAEGTASLWTNSLRGQMPLTSLQHKA